MSSSGPEDTSHDVVPSPAIQRDRIKNFQNFYLSVLKFENLALGGLAVEGARGEVSAPESVVDYFHSLRAEDELEWDALSLLLGSKPRLIRILTRPRAQVHRKRIYQRR
jgi:hypothetical protein